MKGNKNICTVKGCRNEGAYCRFHLSYTVPVKTEIPKQSETQKEILKKYKPIRAQYLREHPFCEAKIEGCQTVSNEIHHKIGKVGEADYLNTEFFLAVCRTCHNCIEKNPAWSKQQGFSLSRLQKRA